MGYILGGLGHVNILASILFLGMSCFALAGSGDLDQLEIKMMHEARYDDEFYGLVTAVISIIGPIILPSIPIALYSVITNTIYRLSIYCGNNTRAFMWFCIYGYGLYFC